MKKMLFVCIALAMLFGVIAKADMIITTADDGWYVAYLGHQDVLGEDWSPDNGSTYNDSDYKIAAKNYHDSNPWWWQGQLKDEPDSVWVSRVDAMDANGYYSYMTSVDGSTLLGLDSMNITFSVDDRVAAIYINGLKIDTDIKDVDGNVIGTRLPQGPYGNTWEDLTTLDEIMFADYSWNEGGINWIEFIVENDNRLDSYNWETDNWTGLYADIKFVNSNPSGSTPEPATLLILGLATVGAGFAARRRK